MSTPPGEEPQLLEVGRVGKAHGLRGDVVVRLTSDRTERVAPGSELQTAERTLVVNASRPHQKGFIVTFEGVDSREGAEALRGQLLYATPLDDPDTLWVHELIGARVQEVDGTARGVVDAVQENPASDLLVTDDGALIPLTFVVDASDGLVVVDVPAGLFEDLDEAADRP